MHGFILELVLRRVCFFIDCIHHCWDSIKMECLGIRMSRLLDWNSKAVTKSLCQCWRPHSEHQNSINFTTTEKKAKIRSHPHIQRNSLSPSNIHKDTAVGTYVEICLVALSNDGLVCRFFVIIKAHKSCCIQSTQSHTFKRKHTYACASFHRP